MTPLRFNIRVDTDSTRVEIKELRDRLHGALGPDWAGPAVSTEIANIFRERFDSGGFGEWPPLMPSTVQARARRWGYYRSPPEAGVTPTGPILVWTGRLRHSLDDPRGRGAHDAIVRMSPTLLEQGTRVPYARWHMGPDRRGTRPARKPVDLRPEDEERLAAVYREFVLTGEQ